MRREYLLDFDLEMIGSMDVPIGNRENMAEFVREELTEAKPALADSRLLFRALARNT